ncbi:peptidase S66 [Clostridia bacterium]|nr:peptidase S66 [Clostridia bacterium]
MVKFATKLKIGDTIGIVCPSHVADPVRHKRSITVLEPLGYKVKIGKNVYKDTYGYCAGADERADDFNEMVADKDVKMVLFGGGQGAAELLPLIDCDAVRCNPKLFCSYSDGTSIINVIHAQTGLVTYYGCMPGAFNDLRYYDLQQFTQHFVEGNGSRLFLSDSEWRTINGGVCEGELIGGYLPLFGMLQGNKYFDYDKSKKYILFLEDHEKFSSVGAVATYLAFIEQSAVMQSVSGVIFGHYSDAPSETLFGVFERFAKRNNIPAVYTDDFGHGTKHAIFPIGASARLDTITHTLEFYDY